MTSVFVWILSVVVVLYGCSGKPKVYHVGILSGAGAFSDIKDGFQSKMTELGYVEGKSIFYDIQELNEDPAGEQRVIKKFTADKIDLIFAFPTEPALTSKEAADGTNIPVVTPESHLRINYRIAKKLDLKISENLLSQAREIIRQAVGKGR